MFSIERWRLRLSSYSRELLFVLRNSLDWRTRVVLLANTMLFHVRNAFGRAPISKASFSARLRLNSSRVAEIVLRPFAGDIFVLFEVLLGRCYQIPDAILSPEGVHVILDCGANIGITSLYFASRYSNARIFSIEPDKENFALLKRNTAAEPRIIPIHGAIVGRARKSVHLTTSNPAWGNFITEQGEGLEVPALAVEQILELNGLSRIDLLKVDIEGAERELFTNCEFLQRVGFVIIELHDGYHFDQFSADVARFGFRALAPKNGDEFKMIIAEQSNRYRESQ